MKTWPDFLAAFWKGPGWFPGTERLGDITFVSERPERKKYDEDVSPLLHIYTLTHFVLSFMISDHINSVAKVCFIFQNINIFGILNSPLQFSPYFNLLMMVFYCAWGLTNIGLLYEKSPWCWMSELFRCVTTILFFHNMSHMFVFSTSLLHNIFLGSTGISAIMLINSLARNKIKTM